MATVLFQTTQTATLTYHRSHFQPHLSTSTSVATNVPQAAATQKLLTKSMEVSGKWFLFCVTANAESAATYQNGAGTSSCHGAIVEDFFVQINCSAASQLLELQLASFCWFVESFNSCKGDMAAAGGSSTILIALLELVVSYAHHGYVENPHCEPLTLNS